MEVLPWTVSKQIKQLFCTYIQILDKSWNWEKTERGNNFFSTASYNNLSPYLYYFEN